MRTPPPSPSLPAPAALPLRIVSSWIVTETDVASPSLCTSNARSRSAASTIVDPAPAPWMSTLFVTSRSPERFALSRAAPPSVVGAAPPEGVAPRLDDDRAGPAVVAVHAAAAGRVRAVRRGHRLAQRAGAVG